MLVAEALAQRKTIHGKISSTETAISTSAITYEDEEPDYDPEALLTELHSLGEEFASLSVRINRTNNDTFITFDGDEMSMMEAVALRDNLLLRKRGLDRIADAIESAQGKGRYGYNRRSKDDLKQNIHLPTKRVRKESADLAQRIERLNIVMQAMNWTTELIEA